MIHLQRLTGMRPGEVLIMRPRDITMTTDGVWKYRPKSHKTEHHGKERVVFRALFQLMIAREELEQQARKAFGQKVERMGPEELQRVQLEAATELIREQPQIAILAANRLGWTVQPPEEQLE